MWAAAPGHLRRIQWSTRHDRKYFMWTEKYFMLTKNICYLSYLLSSAIGNIYWLSRIAVTTRSILIVKRKKTLQPGDERGAREKHVVKIHRWWFDILRSCSARTGQQPAACGATSYWRETAEIIIRSYSFSLVGQSSGKLSWSLHYKAWLKPGIWYSQTSKQTINVTSYVIWDLIN